MWMPLPAQNQAESGLQRWADVLSIDLAVVTSTAMTIALILVGAYAARRLLRLFTRRIERLVDDGDATTMTEREKRGRTLAQLANSVGAVTIAIGGGLMVLNQFIEIGPLLAGVGVAGLAISFGAQSLVKDVISGFFILLENQFGIGEVVDINGVGGVVERMTLRVVVLRDVNGVLHIIPNGNINMVSNKTRGWARAVIDIGVAYKENVDRVIAVMRDEAKALWADKEWRPRLVDEPAVWGVEALGEYAVTLRLVANTQPGQQWDVGREIRRRIKNRFDEESIEIPFPQRTLHFGAGAADSLEKAAAKREPTSAGR